MSNYERTFRREYHRNNGLPPYNGRLKAAMRAARKPGPDWICEMPPARPWLLTRFLRAAAGWLAAFFTFRWVRAPR